MTRTSVLCRIGPLPDGLPLALKVCLFRVVQEGLNNAFRHAGGRGQCITASASADGIKLVVSDSGHSPSPPSKPSNRVGLGIPGLRRRVEAFKGVFEFTSQSAGTHIWVTLPVATDPRSE